MVATSNDDAGALSMHGQLAVTRANRKRNRPTVWTRLARDSKCQLGVGLVGLVVLTAVAAPLVLSHGPEQQDVMNKLLPPAWQERGQATYRLGTDSLGRDILTRTLYGGRLSLAVGLVATAGAAILGITLGVLAGYFGRHIDALIMRVTDVQMAFPAILLALGVMVMLGPGVENLILVLMITSWVEFARIVRAEVLSIKHREFMEAGIATGNPHIRLILRYLMPNLVGSITVITTLTLARVIIAESSLSFLGLGVQPPTPSWGGMISEGRAYVASAWWISTIPGIVLVTTVVSVNLVGDALRDALDPRASSH